MITRPASFLRPAGVTESNGTPILTKFRFRCPPALANHHVDAVGNLDHPRLTVLLEAMKILIAAYDHIRTGFSRAFQYPVIIRVFPDDIQGLARRDQARELAHPRLHFG